LPLIYTDYHGFFLKTKNKLFFALKPIRAHLRKFGIWGWNLGSWNLGSNLDYYNKKMDVEDILD
jgi:hypothetical protein